MPVDCLGKVTYHLHATFNNQSRMQTRHTAPFGLRERAWGEFRIHIIATPYGLSRADDVEIWHQLRLLKGKYEEVYPVCVKDPPPILLERLGMSHPVSAIRASVLKEVIAKQMLDEYQDKHAASNSTGKALSEFELGDLEAPVRKNVDTLGRKDALEWFKATHKGRLDAVRAECAKLACDELEDKLDDIFSDAMPSDSLAPLNHDTLLAQEVEYGVVDEASKLAGNAAE